MSFFAKAKSFVSTPLVATCAVGFVNLGLVLTAKEENRVGVAVGYLGGAAVGGVASAVNNKLSEKKVSVITGMTLGGAAGIGSYYGAKHLGMVGVAAVAVAEEAIEVVVDEIV